VFTNQQSLAVSGSEAAVTDPPSNHHVRLYLLGGFEARVRDDVLTLQPAMQRLIALIALSPRGVDRCRAAFQLWPDTNEERAKANLRSTLWRLNKTCDAIITATKTQLRLAQDVWVDARDGIEALGRETSSTASAAMFDVLMPFQALQSELLPDWYDDWLVIERERLRQLTLSTLERRSQSALESGQTADAVEAGLAAVAIDPLRESSRRLVVRAHLAQGNMSAAHQEYTRYVEALAPHPGLTPTPELHSLIPGAA